MQKEFTLHVNVQLGVTEQLAGLLSLALAKGVKPEAGAAAAPSKTREPAEPKPEPSESAAPAAPAKAEPEITDAEMRQIMHRTRLRIEGEDYKDNAEAPGRVKFHRALTQKFKKLAAFIGGVDKPLLLTEQEQRCKFGEMCAELVGKDDGTIEQVQAH